MPNPMIRIHDLATGEVIDREMNAEEMKQAAAEKLAYKKLQIEIIAEEAAKASAIAKLEALGLNLAEAQAIFG